LLDKALETARRSFAESSHAEAIAICRWVLQVEPKNAPAAALLGDIFMQQGRRDMALLMYGRAVLNQPNNPVYRWKLDSLRRPTPAASATASKAQGTQAATAPKAAKRGETGVPPTTTIYITANTQLSKKDPRRFYRLGCVGPALLLFALVGTLLGALLTPLWTLVGDVLY
jgi:tetratricopeptide (TPR) repeat protein